MKKKIVSIQADIKLAEVKSNQDHILALLNKAKREHDPDIVVLPETWNVGFFPENVAELADDEKGSFSASLISEWANKNQVNVVAGSIAVVEEGVVKNRAFVFNRSGETVASYDKIHLFSPGKEDHFFEHGTKRVTFELDGITCGLIICYDLRFPELTRRLALDGAQVLFVPSEWPYPRVAHWQVLSRARAIENQIFVVTCNGVGTAGELRFCGHSSIIDPFGEVLAEADDQEAIIYSEVDLSKIDEVRGKIPVFRDRKPDIY
jgi:omega-amidase